VKKPDDPPLKKPDDQPVKKPDDPPVKKPDDEPVKKPDDPPVKKPDDPAAKKPEDDPPVKKPDDPRSTSGELPREARKLVKAATVFIKVVMADGTAASGTGFFGVSEAPNLVMTNAHVVGMLSGESKPPKEIEVRIHSGQEEEQRMPARVVAVDRSADLAVLRVDRDTGLPAPLSVKSAKDLEELDKLFTFGFPLGESLGKEITIRDTSVSSLRKKGGHLDRIQVNGGMDPGNSGGPVVDTRGYVVGVAVAGIPGRQINFAIPGDYVHSVLNGRLSALGTRLPYIGEDGQVVVPVTLVMIDPRSLIKEVALDVWYGDPPTDAKAILPPADKKAPTKPSDSEHLHYVLSYANSIGKGDVVLPALPEGKVYWMQPNWVNGAGKGRWATGQVWKLSGQPVERKPALLQARYVSNTIRPLTLKSTLSLRIHEGDDDDDLVQQLRSTVNFKELVAATGPAGTTLKLQYGDVQSEILEDKKLQVDPDLAKVRPFLPSAITILRLAPDGGIKENALDPGFLNALVRRGGQPAVDLVTDFHEPIKHSLEALSVPLPNREMKALEKWTSVRPLPIPSAGRFTKGQVNITYTYLGVRVRNGKNEAVIDIDGVVTGKDKSRQYEGHAEGLALVDLASGQVSLTSTTVKLGVDMNVIIPGLGKKSLRVISILSARLERGGL
jgi:S1-C subfamily serine protease